MKSNQLLTLLFFLSISLSGEARQCAGQTCNGNERVIDVCFIDKAVSTGLQKVAGYANCGYWSERIIVNGASEIESALKKLTSQCVRIKDLVFEGHGRPGYHSTGLDAESAQALSSYSCLMASNATIRLVGCNIGRGCTGDVFLQSVGTSLLHENGGRVSAPTFYASTVLPGIIPIFSFNGRSRVMSVDPKRRPPNSWGLQGLATGSGGSITDVCKNELTEAVNSVHLGQVEAQKKQCSSSDFYLRGETVTGYEQLAKSISARKSQSFAEAASAIQALSYQANALRRCSPPPAPGPAHRARSAR